MYGIFTYIYHKNQLNYVGKYTSPMDPMGRSFYQLLEVNKKTPNLEGSRFSPTHAATSGQACEKPCSACEGEGREGRGGYEYNFSM